LQKLTLKRLQGSKPGRKIFNVNLSGFVPFRSVARGGPESASKKYYGANEVLMQHGGSRQWPATDAVLERVSKPLLGVQVRIAIHV
jgi:hypothetical protein